MIMNPEQMVLTRDFIKVLLHIIPINQNEEHLSLPPLDSIQH